MPRPSVTQNQFAQVPHANIQRSTFNRTHTRKQTMDSSYIYPFCWDEVLPGDSFNVSATLFARSQPFIRPILDNITLDVHWFYVPNRLLWDNWEKFCGSTVDPGDSTNFTVPQIIVPATVGFAVESIYDYFGFPTEVDGYTPNALLARAYNLIYNEWYRDQNIINSVTVNTGDGPDTASDVVLLKRAKKRDYFTSALPWTQKNNTGTAVTLPLGTTAPVTHNTSTGGAIKLRKVSDDAVLASTDWADLETGGAGQAQVTTGSVEFYVDPESTLYADLSTATASTINQIREAFQLQRMYEKDARAGSRYTEVIKMHFGVHSPDGRLQRPEILGVGTSPINISAIPQTSETNTTKQGHLTAIGSMQNQNGFSKSFTEHGVILGLVSIRGDVNYQQGLNRAHVRQTRADFFWPSLQNLGEQAIINEEIYTQGTAADDDVFGYNERYSEYRYKPSEICGKFRSTYATPLDAWHVAEEFSTPPTLSQTFIEDATPMSRVVAVTTEPEFLLDAYIQMRCTRPMPVNSVPGLVDHF